MYANSIGVALDTRNPFPAIFHISRYEINHFHYETIFLLQPTKSFKGLFIWRPVDSR